MFFKLCLKVYEQVIVQGSLSIEFYHFAGPKAEILPADDRVRPF